MRKWFVSCIIQGDKQIGAMQFESTEENVKSIAEDLAPCRCNFQSYELAEGFDKALPVGSFVDAATMKKLGY